MSAHNKIPRHDSDQYPVGWFDGFVGVAARPTPPAVGGAAVASPKPSESDFLEATNPSHGTAASFSMGSPTPLPPSPSASAAGGITPAGRVAATLLNALPEVVAQGASMLAAGEGVEPVFDPAVAYVNGKAFRNECREAKKDVDNRYKKDKKDVRNRIVKVFLASLTAIGGVLSASALLGPAAPYVAGIIAAALALYIVYELISLGLSVYGAERARRERGKVDEELAWANRNHEIRKAERNKVREAEALAAATAMATATN